jgi:hypothetical protein
MSSTLWDAQKTLSSRVTCLIWYTDVKQRAKTRTTTFSALETSKVCTSTLYRYLCKKLDCFEPQKFQW